MEAWGPPRRTSWSCSAEKSLTEKLDDRAGHRMCTILPNEPGWREDARHTRDVRDRSMEPEAEARRGTGGF